MPFWKGDPAGRPLEFGQAIGALVRDLLQLPPPAAIERLTRTRPRPRAAENLLQYLRDQKAAAGAVPDDRTIVIERVPRRARRLARLRAVAVRRPRPCAVGDGGGGEDSRARRGVDVETMWADDGFVVRFPDRTRRPIRTLLLPDADEVEPLVVRQLGSTALFAAKFREAAGAALLLPQRRPGARAALAAAQARRRSAGGRVAVSSFPDPARDVSRVPARRLRHAGARRRRCRRFAARKIRVATVDIETPSPFAASLLFAYVANYIYDGDAPLAERRAQALAIDQSQLRELLGEAELRELLDAESMADVERQLQRLDRQYHVRSADAVHDMLLVARRSHRATRSPRAR